MAELATIARPYAEALFKASAGVDAQTLGAQVQALAGRHGEAERLLERLLAERARRWAELLAGARLCKTVAANTAAAEHGSAG